MKAVTLETIYKKVLELQHDISTIKNELLNEPELRSEFIAKMRDIDLEESIMVGNFAKRYSLK